MAIGLETDMIREKDEMRHAKWLVIALCATVSIMTAIAIEGELGIYSTPHPTACGAVQPRPAAEYDNLPERPTR